MHRITQRPGCRPLSILAKTSSRAKSTQHIITCFFFSGVLPRNTVQRSTERSGIQAKIIHRGAQLYRRKAKRNTPSPFLPSDNFTVTALARDSRKNDHHVTKSRFNSPCERVGAQHSPARGTNAFRRSGYISLSAPPDTTTLPSPPPTRPDPT